MMKETATLFWSEESQMYYNDKQEPFIPQNRKMKRALKSKKRYSNNEMMTERKPRIFLKKRKSNEK